MTFQIVDSFLAGNSNWQSIGKPPSQNAYLSEYGGLVLEETTATGTPVDLTQALFGTINLPSSPSSDGLVYNEFLGGIGSYNFTSSTPGAFSCGPFTEPAGHLQRGTLQAVSADLLSRPASPERVRVGRCIRLHDHHQRSWFRINALRHL
jgi:hypothetical protein